MFGCIHTRFASGPPELSPLKHDAAFIAGLIFPVNKRYVASIAHGAYRIFMSFMRPGWIAYC